MQPPRSKLAVLAGLTLLALNCTDWHVWDDLFARHPASGAKAWTGGDGAISSALPGDKNLWIFGDTLTGSITAGGQRVSGDGDGVLGNTIGLQSNASNPDPSQILFYARSGGQSADITNGTSGYYTQFFDYARLGLTPPAGSWGLWPDGSACLDCTDASTAKLLLSFAEIVFCNPQTDGAACLSLCGQSCTLNQTTCTNSCTPDVSCGIGLRVRSSILGIIANPTAEPKDWKFSEDPKPVQIETDMLWGTAVLVEGSFVYIYGQNSPIQDKLYVARAAPADILKPLKWKYRSGNAWVSKTSLPSSSQLDAIATGTGPLASVTKVDRRGKKRYVLINDHVENDHFVFVRTSSNNYAWPAIDSLTPKVDLASIDTSLQLAHSLSLVGGYCTTCSHNGEIDFRGCGTTYHGRAQPHLSTTSDANGVTSIVFSYVVPKQFDGGTTDASYYRPKFGKIELDNIAPWCTEAGLPCWEGIGRQYNTRTIAKGQDATFTYDVSEAARLRKKLYATIIGGSGDPDLYVRFASSSTNTCASSSAGVIEDCAVAVPLNEKTAYVTVHGYAAGSFMLRTAYAGK